MEGGENKIDIVFYRTICLNLREVCLMDVSESLPPSLLYNFSFKALELVYILAPDPCWPVDTNMIEFYYKDFKFFQVTLTILL